MSLNLDENKILSGNYIYEGSNRGRTGPEAKVVMDLINSLIEEKGYYSYNREFNIPPGSNGKTKQQYGDLVILNPYTNEAMIYFECKREGLDLNKIDNTSKTSAKEQLITQINSTQKDLKWSKAIGYAYNGKDYMKFSHIQKEVKSKFAKKGKSVIKTSLEQVEEGNAKTQMFQTLPSNQSLMQNWLEDYNPIENKKSFFLYPYIYKKNNPNTTQEKLQEIVKKTLQSVDIPKENLDYIDKNDIFNILTKLVSDDKKEEEGLKELLETNFAFQQMTLQGQIEIYDFYKVAALNGSTYALQQIHLYKESLINGFNKEPKHPFTNSEDSIIEVEDFVIDSTQRDKVEQKHTILETELNKQNKENLPATNALVSEINQLTKKLLINTPLKNKREYETILQTNLDEKTLQIVSEEIIVNQDLSAEVLSQMLLSDDEIKKIRGFINLFPSDSLDIYEKIQLLNNKKIILSIKSFGEFKNQSISVVLEEFEDLKDIEELFQQETYIDKVSYMVEKEMYNNSDYYQSIMKKYYPEQKEIINFLKQFLGTSYKILQSCADETIKLNKNSDEYINNNTTSKNNMFNHLRMLSKYRKRYNYFYNFTNKIISNEVQESTIYNKYTNPIDLIGLEPEVINFIGQISNEQSVITNFREAYLQLKYIKHSLIPSLKNEYPKGFVSREEMEEVFNRQGSYTKTGLYRKGHAIKMRDLGIDFDIKKIQYDENFEKSIQQTIFLLEQKVEKLGDKLKKFFKSNQKSQDIKGKLKNV